MSYLFQAGQWKLQHFNKIKTTKETMMETRRHIPCNTEGLDLSHLNPWKDPQDLTMQWKKLAVSVEPQDSNCTPAQNVRFWQFQVFADGSYNKSNHHVSPGLQITTWYLYWTVISKHSFIHELLPSVTYWVKRHYKNLNIERMFSPHILFGQDGKSLGQVNPVMSIHTHSGQKIRPVPPQHG